MPEAEISKRVHEIAELLRIAGKLGNRATHLSGGEMQRVAIGRALVRRPAIYLMDEPLSSLDAKLRADLRLELKRIQDDLGATVLYVTHDQIEAMTMASRIGVIRDGTPHPARHAARDLREPATISMSRRRLGSPQINLIPADLLSGRRRRAARATIGVRTEHLADREAERRGLVGRVHRVEHLGDQNHVHLDYRGQRSRHAGRSAPSALAGRGGGPVAVRSALFRCGRAPHRVGGRVSAA